ncbi:MAG: GNAT family N-acetyltransferase [Thermoguttaceae bacterium]|nr:GNAT family N-acetyltransferase [Thermoguttaceae bacterium]MDW8037720.1 GNAT family N-acetyltransferase [Thermoguttaceae bacterium]
MRYVVDWFTEWGQLEQYATEWNQLAGPVPFRRWEWLAEWWRHYGQSQQKRRSLAVGVVKSPSEGVIGLAPWYMEGSVLGGRVLRLLGDGEVCSDHLSLLCQPGWEQHVGEALAQSLVARPTNCPNRRSLAEQTGNEPQEAIDSLFCCPNRSAFPFGWDLVELADVDVAEPAVEAFALAMAKRGCWVERAPAGHCWVIPLPETWEAFLQMVSRTHRIRLRRIDKRYFATGRAVLHTVQRSDQLAWAMDLLVQLHRQRRRDLGQPDQFVSDRFERFHRQLAPKLFAAGLLELHWLEVDGQPVAAEYHLLGKKTIYAYQSGIAPTAQCDSPGQWVHLALIRRAIQLGYQKFDFLRGDEPYKAHWRAQPQPTETFRIVAPQAAARWRYGLVRTLRVLKSWLRRCLGRRPKPLVLPCLSPSADSAPRAENPFQILSPRNQSPLCSASSRRHPTETAHNRFKEQQVAFAKDEEEWIA